MRLRTRRERELWTAAFLAGLTLSGQSVALNPAQYAEAVADRAVEALRKRMAKELGR